MTLLTCWNLFRPLWYGVVCYNMHITSYTKWCTCAHCNITHKCKLVHTRTHTLQQCDNFLWTYMHRHTPLCITQNSGSHINSHMSWYVPQHSTAFSNHHLPYLQFLDSPHVSLYFQTSKRLCCSSLDLSALPFLIETQLPLSLPVCQPVSQSVSPFTSSLHRPRMPIHKN